MRWFQLSAKQLQPGVFLLNGAALQSIVSMEIPEVPPTLALHQQALEWAARLNQIVAYDAAYLALAESESAEFWTGDKRLANAAAQLGVSWVHHIGELSDG